MVRDPKNLFKWERWEVVNTLRDIGGELKDTENKLLLSETLFVGISIGVFSGFLGSLLFYFFISVAPNVPLWIIGCFLLFSFFLFIFFFSHVVFKLTRRKNVLQGKKDVLYFFSPEGIKKFAKGIRDGSIKSVADMSEAEIKEMNERSGMVEVKPNHWVHKNYLREYKKDKKKRSKA